MTDVKVLIQTWDQDVKTHSDHSAFLKRSFVTVVSFLCINISPVSSVFSYVNLCKCTHRLPWSGKLRTVAGLPWVPILRVLVELNVSLLAGDDIGLRVTPVVGGSSPKRRRLALPAAGELYRSCTDNGEGGTSGREQIIKLITAHFFLNCKYKPFTHRCSQHPPLRALPRPDLNSLMRGWMMGERATRGRWVWPALVEPEPGPEPVSRLEEKFT